MQRARSRPSTSASWVTASALAGPVHDIADQPAGVCPVDDLGDRAERAGQAEPLRDDPADLDRRGGDQPDPLTVVEVLLGERPAAGPDPRRHELVEDLRGEPLDVLDPPALDESERGVLGLRHVAGVFERQHPEAQLLPGEPGQVTGREVLAGGEAAGEPVDRGALHHRVVDVEERRRGRVGVDDQGVRQVGRRPAGGVTVRVRADGDLAVAGHARPPSVCDVRPGDLPRVANPAVPPRERGALRAVATAGRAPRSVLRIVSRAGRRAAHRCRRPGHLRRRWPPGRRTGSARARSRRHRWSRPGPSCCRPRPACGPGRTSPDVRRPAPSPARRPGRSRT